MKWIIYALLIWLAFYWLRHRSKKEKQPLSPAGETMVRCAHCAVYLPASESLTDQGRSFCCTAHLQAARPPQAH